MLVLQTGVASESATVKTESSLNQAEMLLKKFEKESHETMVRGVQKALKGLNCYSGAIDGKWGPGSQEALRRFHKFANLGPAPEEPTEGTLNALETWTGGNCSVEKALRAAPTDKSSASRKKKVAPAERAPAKVSKSTPKAKSCRTITSPVYLPATKQYPRGKPTGRTQRQTYCEEGDRWYFLDSRGRTTVSGKKTW